MTAEEFNAAADQIGSRRQLCARTGIPRRSGDHYALGRKPIPLTEALAVRAVLAGLDHAETAPHPGRS